MMMSMMTGMMTTTEVARRGGEPPHRINGPCVLDTDYCTRGGVDMDTAHTGQSRV